MWNIIIGLVAIPVLMIIWGMCLFVWAWCSDKYYDKDKQITNLRKAVTSLNQELRPDSSHCRHCEGHYDLIDSMEDSCIDILDLVDKKRNNFPLKLKKWDNI